MAKSILERLKIIEGRIKNLCCSVANITLQQVSDNGGFTNDSTLRQGNKDNGFGGGVSLVSNSKELQWENGVQYYFIPGQSIIHANSINDVIPNNNYDVSKGWEVGSKYTNLVTGKTYICTSDNVENAIWSVFPYRSLQFTLSQAGTSAPTFEDIFVDDFGDVINNLSFTYNGEGSYNLVSNANIFIAGKTFIIVSSNHDSTKIECERRTSDTIRLSSFLDNTLQNSRIKNSFRFEIIIYP